MQEELINSRLMIPQCSFFDEYDEIIRINKISTEEEVIIANGKQVELDNEFNSTLSFGQVNGFKVDNNLLSFIFIGLTSGALKKDDTKKMIVNLIKGDELVEAEAICTSKENIEPKDGEQLKTEFQCKVENIEKPEEYKGLEIVSSKDITGIPSNKILLNPAEVDKLIEENKIKNYTSDDFNNENIPIFNGTSINTTDCKEKGIFIINGKFLSNYKTEKTKEFEIELINGEKAECTLPIDENKIECVLEEELKESKIMIPQCSAFDGYDEIIRLNKISSEEKISAPNGKEIKLKEFFDINLSFGQVNDFKVEDKLISFSFVGLTTEPFDKDENITMIVYLIINDELVEEEAKCFAKTDVDPKNGKKTKADFECKIKDIEKSKQCTGLKVISSKDICGIPDEPELINPAIVDELIASGKIKNFGIKENKEKIESIPIFNTTSIDTYEALTKGIFVIHGNPSSKYELKDELKFQIKLLSGEKAECILPEINENIKDIEIKCVLQEELKNSTIMIPHYTVLDGYNEIIRLNKISSEKQINAANGKDININQKYKSNLSFRQTNSFKFDKVEKSISFNIAALTNESLKKDEEINFDVNLLLNIYSKKGEAKLKIK